MPDRPRRSLRWPVAAAALVVPTALAGLTLLWSGPQIEDASARRGEAALAAGPTPAGPTSGGPTSGGPTSGGRDASTDGSGGAGTGDPIAPPGSPALDEAVRGPLQVSIESLVTAAPITFAPDSPELTEQGRGTVGRVLELVVPVVGAQLRVEGFVATGVGAGVLTAQQLSDARAATVRDLLVAGGVAAERIEARGLGEGEVPRALDAGRRVEITVV